MVADSGSDAGACLGILANHQLCRRAGPADTAVRFVESLLSLLRMNWDHEPTPNPSEEGKRTRRGRMPPPLLGVVGDGSVHGEWKARKGRPPVLSFFKQ